jgi:tetratricopeptide (TPR) repeat protein
MNEPDKWDYLIQDYLEDELSPEQRQEVERLRAADPKFRQRMAQYERTYQGLAEMIRAEERKAFDEKFSLSLDEPQVLRPNWMRYARIAAVFVPLCLLAGALWWWGQQLHILPPTQSDLYKSIGSGDRDGSDPQNLSLLEQGEQAIREKRYEDAIRFAEQIPSSDSINFQESLRVKAAAYFRLENPTKAVQKLEQLKQLGLKKNQQAKIHWYLANGYLESKNWEQARTNFQLVLDTAINGYKQAESQAWLDKLNHPLFDWFN